jgi:diguanylate cyclase (GGDEF)-like protein/PAS domain S-box-containing protein
VESNNVSPADTEITPEAYERFFELSPDLMCIAGVDGRFIRLNSQWSRLLGYDLSALEGQPFLQYVHPDDVPATIEALGELRNNQSVTNFVNRYRCKDGTYRWIEWRSQPAGGCIYAAARDITEHQTTETELRKSVEQQKLVATVARLFATGNDFDSQVNQALGLAGHQVGAGRAYVFVDSEDGTTTSNTHEWCAPGVPPQIDALQEVPYEVIPSWRRILATEGRISTDDISSLPEDIRAVLEPQGIVAITIEPMYLHGSFRGFIGFDEVTGQRFWTESERRLLSTIAGVVSNAYERHFGNRRREESEEKLRRILEGTNAGTWEWNVQTGETVFNERWAEIIGYTLEELGPTTIDIFETLTHPDDRRRFRKLIEKHFRGEIDYYECELRMLHKEGHWVWVGDRGKLTQRDTEGHPLKMFGTHIDITDRREALNRLDQSKRLLDLFFKQSLDAFFFMMLDKPVEWNDGVDKEGVLDYVFGHQHITRVNRAMLEQYRAKEGDFVGLTPADFFAHDLEQGRRVWRSFFDQGHLHIDTEEKRFDGEPITIEGDYICLYDDEGRITGHFGVQRDVTEARNAHRALEESERRFRELAIRDELTGLSNRRHVMERLEDEVAKARRGRGGFAVALLDLDRFKRLNDTQGHLAGDYVLRAFAAKVSEGLRSYDILGRYGGEEFLAIFDGVDRNLAARRLETILEGIIAEPLSFEGQTIPVTFSAGLADTGEMDRQELTVDRLLALADERLYAAKKSGRKQVRTAEADPSA